MDSSYNSPQSSLNSGNSVASSSKSKRFSNSIAKVFRKSSSSSQDEITDPLLDEEVDSQLQVELKSLMLAHENLGQQASSLGAELATTRAEALALKSQLEDATSRLTPSPSRSEAAVSPQATTPTSINNDVRNITSTLGAAASPSPSPQVVVGSPFGEIIHEDILALQAQIDLLTADIQNKNENLKAMESARAADALTAQSESDRLRSMVAKTKKEAEIAEAEAKHCIKQVQSGKEAALVAAAVAASDAKVLATRCAALEVTVQRLMEGLENKEKVQADMEETMKSLKFSRDVDPNVLYSVENPSAVSRAAAVGSTGAESNDLFNESSQLSQASDCEAKLTSESATEGMDTASSAITGPLAFAEEKQEASNEFSATIPAVHGGNNIGGIESGVGKSSQVSVVGNGRFFSSGNTNATAPGANKSKLLAVINNSSAVVDKKNKFSKDTYNAGQENEKKKHVINVMVKGAAAVIILGAVSALIRGARGDGKNKEARSQSRNNAAATVGRSGGAGLASFMEA